MNRRHALTLVLTLAVAATGGLVAHRGDTAAGPVYRSPFALSVTRDGATAYVADRTADAVVTVDLKENKAIGSTAVTAPAGAVLAPDGKTLYVTSATEDKVLALDPATGQVRASTTVGRQPMGMALSQDGATLYVCNGFTNDVSIVDTAKMTETGRVAVGHQPRFAALGANGQTLVVTNLLPLGSNIDDSMGAEASLVNLADKSVTNIKLSLGATDVGQVVCSPDGKFAYIPHVLARWLVPPTQLDRGWVTTNALTILDVTEKKRVATVLLDDLDRGAANGHGVAMSADGATLYVTHSGTNEVSVIDVAKLHQMIAERPADSRVALEDDLTAVYRSGCRKRIGTQGRCPKDVAPVEGGVLICNYYSGDLTRLSLPKGKLAARIAVGEQPEADDVRKGEATFNDATICFQGWHACVSCHPDGRSDALAWDLLNDGIGNWKNVKSLLLAVKTPPAMAHGVRSSAKVAVEAGFRYILFHLPTEEEINCTVAYLDAMRPERSPYRKPDGSLSEAAERGKVLFESQEVGCAECHPAPLYTDLNMYDVGTKGKFDKVSEFDTPTLVECWRNAPFLHDGSAVTMREALKDRNVQEWHGHVSQLTDQQLNDLIEYTLSL